MMNRSVFIEELVHVGATALYNQDKQWIIVEEGIVLNPDGSGHCYDSFEELFQHDCEGKTVGELVDALEEINDDIHFLLPIMLFDENGDLVKDS